MATTLATYGLDALGERGRTVLGNGVSTAYGYDAGGRLTSLAHTMPNSPSNSVAYTLAYTNAGQLASAASNNSAYDWATGPSSNNTDRRWLHADARGSVIAQSDGGGNVTAVYSYDAYGAPRPGADRASATPARSPCPRPSSITTRPGPMIRPWGGFCRPILSGTTVG